MGEIIMARIYSLTKNGAPENAAYVTADVVGMEGIGRAVLVKADPRGWCAVRLEDWTPRGARTLTPYGTGNTTDAAILRLISAVRDRREADAMGDKSEPVADSGWTDESTTVPGDVSDATPGNTDRVEAALAKGRAAAAVAAELDAPESAPVAEPVKADTPAPTPVAEKKPGRYYRLTKSGAPEGARYITVKPVDRVGPVVVVKGKGGAWSAVRAEDWDKGARVDGAHVGSGLGTDAAIVSLVALITLAGHDEPVTRSAPVAEPVAPESDADKVVREFLPITSDAEAVAVGGTPLAPVKDRAAAVERERERLSAQKDKRDAARPAPVGPDAVTYAAQKIMNALRQSAAQCTAVEGGQLREWRDAAAKITALVQDVQTAAKESGDTRIGYMADDVTAVMGRHLGVITRDGRCMSSVEAKRAKNRIRRAADRFGIKI